jgi:allophanate hydrolase
VSAGLRVIAPGLHTTIQDLGRWGYQAMGVPVSGALDAVSLRLANRLVGNPDNASALEILYQGPTLEVVAERVLVALAGDAVLELVGEPVVTVGAWRGVVLDRGQVFRVGRLGAACCYLAIAGGFAVAPCLGSASTFVRGGLGGFHGRALRAGDVLPLADPNGGDGAELSLREPPALRRDAPIRVVLGPQDDHFTEAAIAALLGAEFTISKSADRMGMRLDGPLLRHRDGYNIVSDGIATGAIQVPGSGQAIVLLADHQTTGGYPKIATVISADLPVVGRKRPGDKIRFAAVSAEEGEHLRRAQEAELAALTAAMMPAGPLGAFDPERLHRLNLISGVVSGHEEAP